LQPIYVVKLVLMKMFKKITLFVITIVLLVAMPTLLMAQPVDLCPNPADPDCPIDSGTVFLIIAVIGIAVVKASSYNNMSKKAMV
jgi:hypothetical protein